MRQRSATRVDLLTDEGRVGRGGAFAQGLEPPEKAAGDEGKGPIEKKDKNDGPEERAKDAVKN